MDSLFCPHCKSILDIPADEEFIICSVCGERQSAEGNVSVNLVFCLLKILVFENNEFVTKSRDNAFGHSMKKSMAAVASVSKHGEGAKACLF
jgi:hypothetical protein